MRNLTLALAMLPVALASAQRAPTSRSQGLSPEQEAMFQETNALMLRGDRAETACDFRSAERFYIQAIDLDPRGNFFRRIALARLYDKMGRERDAFGEYRALVVGQKNSWSSVQDDPVVLTRYGDLCARFSTLDETTRAYRKAASRSGQSDTFEPATTVTEVDPPLDRLRAAAHTAAAIDHRHHGRYDDQLRELAVALRSDPNYWVALFYRARDYSVHQGGTGMKQATEDMARVESMAPRKYRNAIRWMRASHSIPDRQGRYLTMPRLPGGVLNEPPEIP